MDTEGALIELKEVLGQNPSLSLVIPTKNESTNVHPLLDSLHVNLVTIPSQIIFVDDSDDNTVEVIRSYPTEIPITVIQRRKEERTNGLAGALKRGFDIADGKVLGVMDSDLQHPPELLPTLYGLIDKYDIVIASRYIPGASNEGLRTPYRRIVSTGSIIIAHFIFPQLREIKDTCSGYFMIQRQLVEDAHLNPYGFKMLLELLVRTKWNSLLEVPYEFQSRARGESKASVKQGLMYYYHLYLLFRDRLIGKL